MDEPGAALIRPATAADMAAVARIYDHYILHTAVTFDTEPKPVAVWQAAWRREVVDGPYQFLVAELDGEISAFAYTTTFNMRCAYASSASVSVYTGPGSVGRGLGQALYTELFAGGLPFHKVYAGIALPNAGSVALHEAFGFVREGLFTEVGHKLGRWHDVAWYAKALD